MATETEALRGEIEWLKAQIPTLSSSLAQLQQQHAQLSAAPPPQQHAPPPIQSAPAGGAAPNEGVASGPAGGPHAAAWTEQIHPENGATYYWNSVTGESTYTKPEGFRPGGGGGGNATAVGVPQTKGPPGANLFVVRKMRRGEYDAFNAEDLRREFSKYGTVTRAEITVDKETGWSKGFGFVSFATVEAADTAIQAVHGAWMDGREMKIEKTKEDGSGGGGGGGGYGGFGGY